LIKDLIVFGSYLKAKEEPRDIDVVVLAEDKEIGIIGKVIRDMEEICPIHVEVLKPEDIYKAGLGMALITEGFSVKENKFLNEMLGIKVNRIYSYNLKSMEHNQKLQFNRALNNTMKKIKAEKIGAGAVLVPLKQTGYFEDFLSVWDLKYRTKQWTVF